MGAPTVSVGAMSREHAVVTAAARARASEAQVVHFIGGNDMALQQGELYRCPDSNCACEIQVTKGAKPGSGGDLNPRCCCGKEMQKVK